jgi:hypothetical protein
MPEGSREEMAAAAERIKGLGAVERYRVVSLSYRWVREGGCVVRCACVWVCVWGGGMGEDAWGCSCWLRGCGAAALGGVPRPRRRCCCCCCCCCCT